MVPVGEPKVGAPFVGGSGNKKFLRKKQANVQQANVPCCVYFFVGDLFEKS